MAALRNNFTKYLVAAFIILSLWLVYHLGLHESTTDHIRYLTEAIPSTSSFSFSSSSSSSSSSSQHVGLAPDQILTDEAEASQYCSNYRLPVFNAAALPSRKIYDLLLINTELEMLQLRMGQMSPYVDYFVIIESDQTFTDRPKPLSVRENWDLFRPWHQKMILRTFDKNATSLSSESSTWDRERESRNAMYTQVVPYLTGAQAPSEQDVLLVSDVDEIPKPSTLKALRNCAFPPRTSLHSHFYYYSFQWLSREDWSHPQATVYLGEKTVLPDDLRSNANEFHFLHAAWHCSYCFGSIADMVDKVTSFSHAELDREEFKDPEMILYRVRNGKDFFDRENNIFDRIEPNNDVPDYLLANKDQYSYMLNRDPPNANFKDMDPSKVGKRFVES